MLTLVELLTIIVDIVGIVDNHCWRWWNCWLPSWTLVELLTITVDIGGIIGHHCWHWWNCWQSLLTLVELLAITVDVSGIVDYWLLIFWTTILCFSIPKHQWSEVQWSEVQWSEGSLVRRFVGPKILCTMLLLNECLLQSNT